MKKALSLFYTLAAIVISGEVQAEPYSDAIDMCDPSDAVCVGKILSHQIRNDKSCSGPGIVFFSDDNCSRESAVALGHQRPGESVDQACKRISSGVFQLILSVQASGVCVNLGYQQPITLVCQRYI